MCGLTAVDCLQWTLSAVLITTMKSTTSAATRISDPMFSQSPTPLPFIGVPSSASCRRDRIILTTHRQRFTGGEGDEAPGTDRAGHPRSAGHRARHRAGL